MANYLLYGDKLIKNDATLRDFAQCICDNVPDCDTHADSEEDFKDAFMELVWIILTEDISRTDINYEELMHKYRFEIGEVLYDIENNCHQPLVVEFFEGAEKSFNELIRRYIEYHFDEMVKTT